MDNRMEAVEKLMKKVFDQININSSLNNTHFINDLNHLNLSPEIKIYVAKMGIKAGLIDSGAPKGMRSKCWLEDYIKYRNIKENDIKCTELVKVPVFLETEDENEVVEHFGAYVVEVEIPFLVG